MLDIESDYITLATFYYTNPKIKYQRYHPNFAEWVRTHQLYDQSFSTTRMMWHIIYGDRPKCCECMMNDTAWDNTVNPKTYRKYCSKECTTLAQTRERRQQSSLKEAQIKAKKDVPLTEDQFDEILNSINESTNMVSFVKQHPTFYSMLVNKTMDCPAWWQTRKRVDFLRGGARLSPNPEQKIQQKFNALRNKKCKVCNHNRQYNPVSRRFRLYCSDLCQHLHQSNIRTNSQTKQRVSPPNKNLTPELNSRDWLVQKHHTEKWTKQQIAKFLKVDKETVSNRFKEYQIDTLTFNRRNMEDEIYQFLIQHCVVERNNTTICKPKQLDFFLPEYSIAIEFNGLYWHSDKHDRIDRNYHYNKFKVCQERGVRLLTIFEDEWLYHSETVKSKILNFLHKDGGTKVYARKCTISEISFGDSEAFLDKYHIQQSTSGTIYYGITDSDRLVGVAVFKQRNRKTNEWELVRYATSTGVVGGLSKVIARFERDCQPSKLVSFADNRWHTGESYRRVGFVEECTIPPDYAYVVDKQRIHKFNYRHCFLPKKIKNYDSSLSEVENMKRNNIWRIWDCGKVKFVKRY